MFLIKIFNFLRGYVIIHIKGKYLERFINICTNKNIYLWNIIKSGINEITLSLSIKAFRTLRPIAKKTHTKVRIIKKHGVPILLNRYKKRYVFFIGVIIFIVALILSSQFIWSVEVSTKTIVVPKEKIINAAKEAGLKEGALKSRLNQGDLKNTILYNVDGLSWAWVYIKGTKAVIEVKEKVAPPEVFDKNKMCDVVATKAGVITKLKVLDGYAKAKLGDTVQKGDVLISGVVPSEALGVRFLHSRGEGLARVWYEESGEFPMYKSIRKSTGKEKTYYEIEIFSKKFKLYYKKNIPFENYDKINNVKELSFGKDNYVGISIGSEKYTQIEVKKEAITYEQALNMGVQQLKDKIRVKLPQDAKHNNTQIKHIQKDDKTVKVNVIMEFIEQIGEEIPIDTTNINTQKNQ